MTLFSAILGHLGLSQPDAANYLDVRLDTIKSWCSGRRTPAIGAVDKLYKLAERIETAADHAVGLWLEQGEPDHIDFRVDPGWPSKRCRLAVAAALWAALPNDITIRIVE